MSAVSEKTSFLRDLILMTSTSLILPWVICDLWRDREEARLQMTLSNISSNGKGSYLAIT
jgi:hypothetical protein